MEGHKEESEIQEEGREVRMKGRADTRKEGRIERRKGTTDTRRGRMDARGGKTGTRNGRIEIRKGRRIRKKGRVDRAFTSFPHYSFKIGNEAASQPYRWHSSQHKVTIYVSTYKLRQRENDTTYT